jgi:hypothetical protein
MRTSLALGPIVTAALAAFFSGAGADRSAPAPSVIRAATAASARLVVFEEFSRPT